MFHFIGCQVFLSNTNNLHTILWIQVFLSNINKFQKDLFNSLLRLTGTTTPGQSEPGSNGNERVLHTRTLPSDTKENPLG